MTTIALDWISRHGMPALGGLLMVGVFGLPVPDETLLTFAGVLIAQGRLGFAATWAVASAGSMAGISLSYVLGRTVGLAALARYGERVHLDAAHLARVHRWFERRGKWTLTVGYFVPGVRHLTAVVAGSSALEFGEFARFAYAGACLWTATFLLLGWYLGEQWRAVIERLHVHGMVTLAAIIVAVAAFAITKWRQRPEN